MKKLGVMGLAVLALSACQTGEMMEPTAADPYIGKALVAQSGSGDTFLFNDDGTVGGSLRGNPIVGTYEASATEICSTYTEPAMLVGREFCSTPSMEDGVVTFLRRDGSTSQPYVVEG